MSSFCYAPRMDRQHFVTIFLTISGLLLFSVPLCAQPGGFQLLEEVLQTYRQLEHYQDHGTLKRTRRVGGQEQTTRLRFETFSSGTRLVWRVSADADPSSERVLWRHGKDAFAWDQRLGQARQLPSLQAELAHGFGEGGLDALVVPLLLSHSEAPLQDAEGVALDGPEPCGEQPLPDCWLLTLSRMGGDLETVLWVDRESRLIRRVAVDSYFPGSTKAQFSLQVQHHPISEPSLEPELLAFQPPTKTRWVDTWEQQEVVERDESNPSSPNLGFVDEITVELTTVTLRAVAKDGTHLPNLGPQDLRVRIGKQEIPVLSLDWVTPNPEPLFRSPRETSRPPSARSHQRPSLLSPPKTYTSGLKVLFVQADFEPTRVRGQMKLLPLVEDLLDALPHQDQVAVVTFDSRLRLWRDFTRDRRLLKETLFDAIRPGGHPVLRTSERGRTSLFEHLDHQAAKKAADPERALLVVGEALEKIPGEKDMIFLGWGLGVLQGGSVRMTADYQPAILSLSRAEVSVFVLDVSQADWHSLEVGLQQVARDTGGTYQRTFHFTSQTTKRLARTFAGHYVLTFDRSSIPRPRGKLKINLVGQRGEVLFRPTSY